jgi:hypothetical protein
MCRNLVANIATSCKTKPYSHFLPSKKTPKNVAEQFFMKKSAKKVWLYRKIILPLQCF